ncbi:MAG TPA: SDR family NAD(P)-dependent oxidoreductase [Opitutaceae bacterium]|nr:SDR family NAD(P)-dependent oxidoreductase [Lacunisphaera sp.]HWA09177.1 SDR family NAD(P)-dependent oxidoreductase [Opitutaceae bacterium]
MTRTALVTGGAGFIGSHLAEHLLADGWQVRVLDDLSTGTRANLAAAEGKIEFIQGDVTDTAMVERSVADMEVIFHLAAKVFVPESFEAPTEYQHVNVHGTETLLAAAKKAGVRRVVFSSTCAVYGDTADLPIAEKSPTKPLSPYAATKLAAEQIGRKIAAMGGPAFTVLRYFNVYGPRQNPRSAYSGVITRFVDALGKQKAPQIFGTGEQTRDFIHVSDVVRANILVAAERPDLIATYNVGTGKETTINELFRWLAEAQGTAQAPTYLPARAGDVIRSVADISLIAKERNFVPRASVRTELRNLLR